MYKINQGHLTVFCIVFVWLGGPPSPVRIMTQIPWFMYQNQLGPSGGIYYPNFVPCFVVLYLNGFQNPGFQFTDANTNWIWKPQKKSFQTRKRPFTLIGPKSDRWKIIHHFLCKFEHCANTYDLYLIYNPTLKKNCTLARYEIKGSIRITLR